MSLSSEYESFLRSKLFTACYLSYLLELWNKIYIRVYREEMRALMVRSHDGRQNKCGDYPLFLFSSSFTPIHLRRALKKERDASTYSSLSFLAIFRLIFSPPFCHPFSSFFISVFLSSFLSFFIFSIYPTLGTESP